MSVEDATRADPFEHLPEVLHVCRQTRRSDGCVLDDACGFGIAFHSVEDSQTGFTEVPHLVYFVPVHARAACDKTAPEQVFLQFVRLRVQFLPCICA